MSTRVLLVDDQPVVRAGIRVLIELTDDITICGEAADGAQAVQMARALIPDVILMDIRMPRSDGITATRQITRDPDLADVRIIALTTFDTDEQSRHDQASRPRPRPTRDHRLPDRTGHPRPQLNRNHAPQGPPAGRLRRGNSSTQKDAAVPRRFCWLRPSGG